MTLLGFIYLVAACFGAIVCSVVAKVLADDSKTFVPRLAQDLLRRAALRLGDEYAASFYEEWSAHLIEIPETSGKLFHAVTIYLWGSYRIRAALCPSTEVRAKYLIYKRALDIAFVLYVAPIVLPVTIVLAVIIACDGHWPFYKQDRVGKGGRTFSLWKLRSMPPNAEGHLAQYLRSNPTAREERDEPQKLKFDPRITSFGRWLRRSSMDELPQIWNVFVGDMSLVGPRPLMIEQKELYPGTAYYSLRPGLSGLWQISKRGNGSSFAARACLDTRYLKELKLSTDIDVMLKTVGVVLRGTGY